MKKYLIYLRRSSPTFNPYIWWENENTRMIPEIKIKIMNKMIKAVKFKFPKGTDYYEIKEM